MSLAAFDPDTLLKRLSHRPYHLLDVMIPVLEPRLYQAPILSPRASSLGRLSKLPPEILCIILGMLDIQSIQQLSYVSFHGYTLVLSQPQYRDLRKYVPEALLALRMTRQSHLHSVQALHAALRLQRCAACPYFGAYLFLPACERCCWQCLSYNPSFRMVPPKEAQKYFGLSARQVQQLPSLHVIPAKYGISEKSVSDCTLVSARAAKELGLARHGSKEALIAVMTRRCKSIKLRIEGQFFQREPPQDGSDPLLLLDEGNTPNDVFFGVASIPFPTLSSSGILEEGLWCRGCELTFESWRFGQLPQQVVDRIIPQNIDPLLPFLGFSRRAWLKASFLKHVEQCWGTKQPTLMRELERGTRE